MEDMAYLAGIVDGEGTITIHRHQQYKRRTWQLRPRLIVSNTSLQLLKHLQGRHGGTIIKQPTRHERRKQSYIWRVCAASQILGLLDGMQPFLIVKAEHSKILADFLRSRIKSRARNGAKAPYIEHELVAFDLIAAMNRRGTCN